MAKYHIRIVGGWCGNRMVMIKDNLTELLTKAGYDLKVTHQSIWETYTLPPSANMILQLVVAFDDSEVSQPLLNIRPFIRDLDHQPTLKLIFDSLEEHYPEITGLPAGENLFSNEMV
ncbi:MAG: hypothetical protein JEZ06_02270 [Anaerolineaceae bacterium]|nr:hypothetical protein [Anaerolineaceae bacterium]